MEPTYLYMCQRTQEGVIGIGKGTSQQTCLVCAHQTQNSSVLLGWDGSTADGKVLRDALRRTHGLKLRDGLWNFLDSCTIMALFV